MSLLSRDDRMRYARQISLREIGEAGQLRLMQARVESGHPIASLYLERAGMEVIDAVSPVIAVQAGEPALAEAASFLSGALSAVEAIKATLGVGDPLPAQIISLTEEQRS